MKVMNPNRAFRIGTVITIGLTLSNLAGAQCKFNVDEVDPITSKRTRAHAIKIDPNCWLSIGDDNGQERLMLMINDYNLEIVSDDTTAIVILKFGNGDTLNCKISERASTSKSLVNTGAADNGNRVVFRSQNLLPLLIDERCYAKIIEAGLVYVRVILHGRVYDYPVRRNDSKKIGQYAACIRS